MLLSWQEILIAVLTGIVPTFLWLWFWLSEDRKHPEPTTMLVSAFIVGAIAAVITLPIQEVISSFYATQISFNFFFALASAEEIIKFGLVFTLISLTPFVDEPIDYAVYLVTGALGFAALENTLYLLDPVRSVFSEASVSIIGLRFLGSTLLHAITGALLGLSLGFTWHRPKPLRSLVVIVSVVSVVLLHAGFNYFIVSGTNTHMFLTFATLWIIAILSLYLFERIRYIK